MKILYFFKFMVFIMPKMLIERTFKGLFPFSFYNDYCHFYPTSIETNALF